MLKLINFQDLRESKSKQWRSAQINYSRRPDKFFFNKFCNRSNTRGRPKSELEKNSNAVHLPFDRLEVHSSNEHDTLFLMNGLVFHTRCEYSSISALCTVKSKLKHPPRTSSRAFEFLENVWSNSPSRDRKAVQMPFQVIKCSHPVTKNCGVTCVTSKIRERVNFVWNLLVYLISAVSS